jgi:rod shape-determining protein MreC
MLCVALMLVDNRFAISQSIRTQISSVLTPVWWLVGRPYSYAQNVVDAVQSNQNLRDKVKAAEQKQLKSDLANQQLWVLQSENSELRALLNAQQRVAPRARLVEIITINPEANQKRFVINQGTKNAVKVGQVVIDSNGLVGQISEVHERSAVVIVITDADHAVPVMDTRSGFRSIVYGQGDNQILALANLTPSDDVKLGDVLVTSGVGGRFPAGIPVGVVNAFQQDAILTFLNADVTPFARLGYGRHMLLLEEYTAEPKAQTEMNFVQDEKNVKSDVSSGVKP